MPAGFWVRLGSGILDAIIIGIPFVIISLIITGNGDTEYITNSGEFLYSLLLPVFWNGYTIGKRINHIRIRKLDGSAPGIGTMLLRVVVAGIVYGVTLGVCLIISIVMVSVREDKRAIHDFIAGTQVVHD